MKVGTKVRLKTFNGDKKSPINCDPSEDYWKLIGETGIVIEPENDSLRVLLKFDSSVSELGLHCHNKEPNSLFILTTDLEII